MTAPLFPQSTGDDALERVKRAWEKPARFSFFTEINNTFVGILYVVTGFLFFLGAGVLALVMRLQLATPGATLLSAERYNQFFTMHGTVMMFLFAVPVVEAVAVLLLPNMLGTRDMPFPRLSALGYWSYAFGGLLVFSSLFFNIAPDSGWFMYPPLTSITYSPGLNTEIWILGLGFVEVSAVAAAVELIVGILRTRAAGMSLATMPIFAWYMLVTAGMIMIGMPTVIAADLLLELERAFNMPFYDATRGGDPLLWQHLFWLFGHPEVYIIFLPAAGMVSMILPTFTRTRLVGHVWIIMAAISVGFLSFGLWVHHMFTTGLPLISTAFFSAASSAIAIPMGVQMFAWLATLWEGKLVLSAPMRFVLGFFFTFTLGGLTGVMVAAVPYDWQVHDSYFVVAHFHYVLIGGMVFPLFAAFYYWMPAITNRRMSEKLGRLAFWLMFIGFNAAFLPMHLTGLRGMPRRVYTYAPDLGWNTLNMITTFFSFVFAVGVLVVVYDFFSHLRTARSDALNPWDAASPEWMAPLSGHGYRSLMPVTTAYPLWDQPNLPNDEASGRGFLPDAPTIEREALITSAITAEPQQILRMPGPGWAPFLASLFLAITTAAMTFRQTAVMIAAGALSTVVILRWLWTLDRAYPRENADAGRGLALPLYANGTSSVGWWAMTVLLIADGVVFASLFFSYLFLWVTRPAAFIPAELPHASPALSIISVVLVAAAAASFALATRYNATNKRAVASLALASVVVLALVALFFGRQWMSALGLDSTAKSRGAITWTIGGYAAVHVLIGGAMALWCLIRLLLGMIDSWRSATLHNCLLWWGFTTAACVITILLIEGFPRVVG